jgi:hypothetical protein
MCYGDDPLQCPMNRKNNTKNILFIGGNQSTGFLRGSQEHVITHYNTISQPLYKIQIISWQRIEVKKSKFNVDLFIIII